MCEFISWIELDGEIFFLDNDKLNTKDGRKLLNDPRIPKKDIHGHGAIRAYYPELKDRGRNRECTDFSSPKNFPDVIVKAFKAGRLFELGFILRGIS